MGLTGKLPPELLKEHVLRFQGAKRKDVMAGPGVGEDAAVVRLGKRRYLLVSTDPIVGAGEEDAGRFLVEINVNDIAAKGGDPLYLMLTLLVPPRLGVAYIERTMAEIHRACERYGMAVIGGHTEITPDLDRPLLSATIIGRSNRLLSMKKASVGDLLFLVGEAALEGAYLIYTARRNELKGLLTSREEEEVRGYKERLSVYPYSRLLRRMALFMHDPTEGGVLGGMAEFDLLLDGKGIKASDHLRLRPPVEKLCRHLGIDPGRLISSGALLALIPRGKAEKTKRLLERAGHPFQIVGEVAPRGDVSHHFEEELWKHLKGHS
jgi:hydrogenase maturation factor